jgi:hypothetical protein
MKRHRRESVRTNPVDDDLHKESDRLFAFIMIVLAVIVVGSIVAVV